jgi:hypothetical protein
VACVVRSLLFPLLFASSLAVVELCSLGVSWYFWKRRGVGLKHGKGFLWRFWESKGIWFYIYSLQPTNFSYAVQLYLLDILVGKFVLCLSNLCSLQYLLSLCVVLLGRVILMVK